MPPGEPVETAPGDIFESNHAWCGTCLQHPVLVEARTFGLHLRCEACGWEEVYQRVRGPVEASGEEARPTAATPPVNRTREARPGAGPGTSEAVRLGPAGPW